MKQPSVGRINHKKGYEPGNCKWEEWSENRIDACLRMGASNIGRKRTFASRKNQSRKLKGRKLSVEHRIKISLANIGNTYNLGKKDKPKTRKKKSITQLARWSKMTTKERKRYGEKISIARLKGLSIRPKMKLSEAHKKNMSIAQSKRRRKERSMRKRNAK